MQECMESEDKRTPCEGAVQLRLHPYTTVSWPRCDIHFHRWMEKLEENERRYHGHSDVPPSDFDPTYAGERWDED